MKTWGRQALALAMACMACMVQAQMTGESVVWVRSAYSNAIKHGGTGIGVGLATRPEPQASHALVVELASQRPVGIDRKAELRVMSGRQVVLVLQPATAWNPPSSVSLKVKNLTINSMRQAYPVTTAQLETLLRTDKPTLQVMHAEGMAESRLHASEIEDLLEAIP
jgi:hypothetical protein